MPIYEYECRKCGKLFEVIQKMDEGGKNLKCPSCGKKGPERIISCCFSSSKGSESVSPVSPSSCGSGPSRFS